VVRTRVGYSGGVKQNPTYYELGNHTETYQVDFDPGQISYSDLIEVFWALHNPHAAVHGPQYKAVVFFHNTEQEQIARDTAARIEAESGRTVTTEIREAETFWLAEDYHQKYALRNTDPLIAEMRRFYDVDSREFIDSTLAARLNAYAGLRGHESILLDELASYGATPATQEVLREVGPLLRSEAVAVCGLVDNGI